MEWLYYSIGAVVIAVITFIVGRAAGISHRKKVAEAEIGSAEEQAKRILEESLKTAETKKKEALLAAKEEIIKLKTDTDEELKERRKEISKLERRAMAKEEALDAKSEALEQKTEQIQRKAKEAEELNEKIKETLSSQIAMLEKIAGYTAEQAKAELIARMESETKHELAVRYTALEAEFKEQADSKAKNLIALAVQRCAADHISEIAISVVNLPNEEMKGRIIGREGRNIRTIETMTGVDLIIDDTPEVITLSGFDPVRREIARIALERLIADGRIHPARIEEMVERAQREVEASIKQAGEKATFETGVHGLNPELVKLLGRMKYRTSYGQNVLRHSIEVSLLSGILADELGADSTLAKRAGLLHDIGKAMTAEVEGTHVQIGIDIARKYKESKEVIHAIEAHHGDVEASSLIALIVQAADAISAARPGARREDLENYIKRLQKLEEIANSFDGVDKTFAIQAGREIRVLVKPEQISDDDMTLIARDIARKIESELEYPGQIKVHVIRESRACDFAK